MDEHVLRGLGAIVVLGISAQWLAWRLHVPSILFLLLGGFLAGPVSGFLDPDSLLGAPLVPLVSISVAIILYEGGLSLDLQDLRTVGRAVRNLITLGALVTFLLTAAAAHWILGFEAEIAILLGAILVVTGPTVITPLLHHIRPRGRVGHALRWEGIVIDPIGAMLAVLVYEATVVSEFQSLTSVLMVGVLRTLAVGTVAGLLAAGLFVMLLKRYWVAEHLENAVSLTLVVAAHVLSNHFQPESGLLAATVMGITLANQQQVGIKHIVEFKENLQVLLLSVLFIVLASRLRLEDIQQLGPESLVFLLVLIVLVRPLAVVCCSFKSTLNWRERVFVAWMAPRGIVAAAVASVFAPQLEASGQAQAALLVPVTFLVIVGTILVYATTAPALARGLGVSQPHPQGVLFVGAHDWARALALELHKRDFRVRLVDVNFKNISAARMAGLPTHFGNVLSKHTEDNLELDGIGRMLAVTSNPETNALAALHFRDLLGRREVYQLPSEAGTAPRESIPAQLRGRPLFAERASFEYLTRQFSRRAEIRTTRLSEDFTWERFQRTHGENALPLFLLHADGRLSPFSSDADAAPKPGDSVMCLFLSG